MQTRLLYKDGPLVSILGYGTGGLGNPHADLEAAHRVLDTLLDHGVNLIDTAACYGDAERHLGRWLKDSPSTAAARNTSSKRDRVVIVSKCGHHDVLPDGSLRSRRITLDDIDAALTRLQTDYLDVMLLHSYDRDLLEAGDAIDVLARAQQQGKIRAFGYSGDNETAAYAATIPGLRVIETSINLVDQANLDTVVPLARKRGLGVIAKRPLANAVWRYADLPLDEVPDHPREYARRLRAMNLDPVALGQPDRSGQSWAALALTFTLASPGVTTAIVGTTHPTRAHQNTQVATTPIPPETYHHLRNSYREATENETWMGQN